MSSTRRAGVFLAAVLGFTTTRAAPLPSELLAKANAALAKGRQFLIAEQEDDGRWAHERIRLPRPLLPISSVSASPELSFRDCAQQPAPASVVEDEKQKGTGE